MIPFDLNKIKSLTLKQINRILKRSSELVNWKLRENNDQNTMMYKPSKITTIKRQENFQIIY